VSLVSVAPFPWDTIPQRKDSEMPPDHSDQFASVRVATASLGVAFVLAAIGAAFLNYGIAIGFGIGALICFIAANNFHVLANLKFRLPFESATAPQRGEWHVFKLITYTCVGISLIFSTIFGTIFYLRDLQDRLVLAQHGRHLNPAEKSAIIKELSSFPGLHGLYVMSAASCDECEEYAQDFRDTINQVPGWQAGGGVNIMGTAAFRGLKLETHDMQSVPEITKRISAALNEAHLKFDLADGSLAAYEGSIFVERAPR
jgi:hypothetical protein